MIFLFGVALMNGKCGSVIDAANHVTNAWDGFITERGHFILKGLQAVGIAIGFQILVFNYYLCLDWLRYLALGILIVSALLVYYLEGKLYVNKGEKAAPIIPISAETKKKRNEDNVMQPHTIIGLIIGAILILLFIYGIPIAGRIYGINVPDGRALWGLFYRSIFIIATIWYTIVLVKNKRLLSSITKTSDPDEKICLIDRAIQSKCPNPLKKTGRSRELACAAKVGFLLQAANTYISKEDYNSALNRLTEARTLFGYLGDDQADSDGLGIHEQCILAESVCLSHLGYDDEAAKLIAPFMSRLETMDDIGVSLTMIARFEHAICVNDSQFARKVVVYIKPIFERLERKFGPDVKADYFLMDGIVDMLEGMYEQGMQKLSYVINNTNNYGNLRRAKKLLNYS